MAARVGSRIGRIRIEGRLGEGGMGTVYVGFDEKLGRRVAIKTLRERYVLRADARARFLREAQVLAQLAHPCICQLYDVLDVHGEDLLVLELIDGITLTEALKQGLHRGARHDVARQLADVLVATHAQGIVHRDLKPDNVMLTPSGTIKVLDFGLARPLDDTPIGDAQQETTAPFTGRSDITWSDGPPSTEPRHPGTSAPFRTQVGKVMGTLRYMSPEQAAGGVITPASDMYSCGLILQEVFTGRRIHAGDYTDEQLYQRVRRGESEPVRGIRTDLSLLIRRLKSHDPAARPAAAEVVLSLERIRTRPMRTLRIVAALTLLALFLAGGLKYTRDLQRERAEAEQARAEAEQVALVLEDLFRGADPNRARGEEISAREILDQGVAKIRVSLADQPLVRARMLHIVGAIYADLGQHQAAIALLREALALREAGLNHGAPEVADTLVVLGRELGLMSRTQEAESVLQRALRIRTAMGAESVGVAEVLLRLGRLYAREDDYDRAEPLLLQALPMLESSRAADLLVDAHHNLADLYKVQDRFALAEHHFLAAIEIAERELGQDAAVLVTLRYRLGELYVWAGRDQEALPILEASLDSVARYFGPTDYRLGIPLTALAILHTRHNEYAVAEGYLQRSLAIERASLGPRHPNVAGTLSSLSELAYAQGQLDEAEAFNEEALQIFVDARGPTDIDVAWGLQARGRYASLRGDTSGAVEHYLAAIAIIEQVYGAGSVRAASCRLDLARTQIDRGELPSAAQTLDAVAHALAGSDSEADQGLSRAILLALRAAIVQARGGAARTSWESVLAALDAVPLAARSPAYAVLWMEALEALGETGEAARRGRALWESGYREPRFTGEYYRIQRGSGASR